MSIRPRFGPGLASLQLLLWLALPFALLADGRPALAQNASGRVTSVAGTGSPPAATGRKVLTIDDYPRWRSIEGSQISSDGKWVSYVLRHTNVLPIDSKPALHILNLDTNQEVVVENASNASFSPDGKWIVYQVDSVRATGGRGRGAGAGADSAQGGGGGEGGGNPAQPPRLELRELATGRVQSWQNMQNPAFAPTSKFLLMRRRPAPAAGGDGRGQGGGGAPGGGGGGGRGGGAGGGGSAVGTDGILNDLTTGRSHFIGSVGEAAFDRKGDLLAYAVSATGREGNGLFLMDLASAVTRALDNDTRIYSRLTWNDAGSGIAALKGRDAERMRERENVLIVFPSVREAASQTTGVVLDPASTEGFTKGFVISERATLQWSEDGQRVFFSTMPQTPSENARRRSTDSVPDVDIWRTQDTFIQSVQMIRAEQERNFTFRQAFDVAAKRFTALTDSTMREIQIAPDGRWAVGRDDRPYVSDYREDAADFYRVDTRTGERTPMFRDQLTGQHAPGISPDGRRFLYWKDGVYHSYDLDAATTRQIGAGAPSFVNTEFDRAGTKPPYGTAGYTKDGKALIAYAKHDVWLLPLDGAAARNLTNGVGAQQSIRFRLVRTEPVDSTAGRRAWTGQEIDLSKPITLNAFGELTKKDGFYRLAGGRLEEIVYEDAAFSTPQRAQKAERYLFTRQTFAEYPNLRVSGPRFGEARQISDANPQHTEYMWGRRTLIDYEDRDGHKLQALLTVPDDYRPGERRPMLVNFYEKNSQNLNRHSTPSFITGMGAVPIEAVSRGYVVLIPDVYFHTGSSHTDMLDAVEAATRKVIELGYADPARIGVNGHSYGGEGAQFIATRSKLFAAVGAGAGVTDLYTDFSQNWGWSYQVTGGSGANGNEYYINGQGRWGVSPWDQPDVYRAESAITHAPDVTAAVLIMHGTDDPTVPFNESLKFYNALRYNGKNAILLAYPGEPHGLRGLANRRDLTVRYFEFFDHYLKGAPAPAWITEGVPYLKKNAALAAPATAAPAATAPATSPNGGE